MRHSNKILVQFYGHTHTDTFRLYTSKDQVEGIGLIAPSVTPLVTKGDEPTSTNPGVRLYTIDIGLGRVMDYHQYYLDLAHNQTTWSLAYSFQDAYGMPDLTIKSMETLFLKIQTNETLFKLYYKYNTLLYDNGKGVFISIYSSQNSTKRSEMCGNLSSFLNARIGPF